MVSSVKEGIKNWFSQDATEEKYESKVIMQVRINKLFKGHSAHISTFMNDICIFNSYFEASSHQRVSGDKVHVKLVQEFMNPKWLNKKLDDTIALLKPLKNTPIDSNTFVLQYQGFEYRLSPGFSYVEQKYTTTVPNMLDHWESIKVFKKMKRLYPILRNRIKEVEPKYLADMAYGIHKDQPISTPTWYIHPNIIT